MARSDVPYRPLSALNYRYRYGRCDSSAALRTYPAPAFWAAHGLDLQSLHRVENHHKQFALLTRLLTFFIQTASDLLSGIGDPQYLVRLDFEQLIMFVIRSATDQVPPAVR